MHDVRLRAVFLNRCAVEFFQMCHQILKYLESIYK